MIDFLIGHGVAERDANNITALTILVLAMLGVWVLHEIYRVLVMGLKPSWLRRRPLVDLSEDER